VGVGCEGKAVRKIGVEHCEVYTEAECVGVYLCCGFAGALVVCVQKDRRCDPWLTEKELVGIKVGSLISLQMLVHEILGSCSVG